MKNILLSGNEEDKWKSCRSFTPKFLGSMFDAMALNPVFVFDHSAQLPILEINGDTYHINSAKDHNRGRLFKLHGIKVFEPYEASRCVKEPEKVVQEFLELIKRNG